MPRTNTPPRRTLQAEADAWRSLEGKFFHVIAEDGYIERQGYVVAVLEGGLAFIQLFEWISGDPSFTGRRLIRVEEMVNDRWCFYATNKEMNDSWQHSGKARPMRLPPFRDESDDAERATA